MENLKKLDDYFATEMNFLSNNIPNEQEDIVLKMKEAKVAVNSYKDKLIELRESSIPKEYDKIVNNFNETVKSFQLTLECFASKLNQKERLIDLKLNMMEDTEFPMDSAIKCIPDFYGTSQDLNTFLDQINYFYNKIPKGVSLTPLINVIQLKLKGKAKPFTKTILKLTWEEIEKNLLHEFGDKKSFLNIFKRIDNLSQYEHETFKAYKNRALEILFDLEIDKNVDNFAMENLRIHFIAGLKNTYLQQTARNLTIQNFRDFLSILEEKRISNEEFENLYKDKQRINSQNFKNEYSNKNQDVNDKRNFSTHQNRLNNYQNQYNYSNKRYYQNRFRNNFKQFYTQRKN